MEEYLEPFAIFESEEFYLLENEELFIDENGFTYSDNKAKSMLLHRLKESEISRKQLNKLKEEIDALSYKEIIEIISFSETSEDVSYDDDFKMPTFSFDISSFIYFDELPKTLPELIDSLNLTVIKLDIDYVCYYVLIQQ